MTTEPGMIERPCRVGHSRLWEMWGLSYASFLTMPRVLMHEMPDEWQGKMADLIAEYEEVFPNQEHLPGTRVQAVHNDRLVKFPKWVLDYRRPNLAEINKLRAALPPPKATEET